MSIARSTLTPIALLGWLGAAGCAGAPETRIAPTDTVDAPAPMSREHGKVLAEVEKLYRAGDPAFAARRDEIARDPEGARGLARLFIYDAIHAFDHRQASDDEFLRQAAGVNPVWDRALANLRALGGAAAPTLVEDLLRHRDRHDRRRLGVSLLGVVGEAGLPGLKDVLASPDAALRRLAVLAVGEMEPTPATLAALRRSASDREFMVRAAAYEGMGRHPEAAADLRAALAGDADAHVRRMVARALGGDRTRATGAALVAYMRASLAAQDRQGFGEAHDSLSRLAGRDARRARGVEAWEAWVAAQPERWEASSGAMEDRPR